MSWSSKLALCSKLASCSKLAVLAGALVVAGCLESPPPPVTGWVSEGGVPPAGPPDGGAAERAPDTAADPDAAPPVGDGGAEAWAGTWQFVSGSSGVNCGASFVVEAVEGFLLIAPAPDGLTVTEDGCSFHFALAGDTATQTPAGQACPKWAIPSIPEWTLTMKPDGTLEEKLGGRVSLMSQSCMISGRATLRRQ